jgi:hypothetical protein
MLSSNATLDQPLIRQNRLISRTRRIRGTRQNVSTDHPSQNVEPSRRGVCAQIYASGSCDRASEGARNERSGCSDGQFRVLSRSHRVAPPTVP